MLQEIICLNFQGNKGMCGTNDDGKCFSLNAMHGHDVHVVCFAFDSYNMQTNNKVFKTLNSAATDTDHIPVVCFQQNQREEVRNMGNVAGAIVAESGMHNTNYVVYPGNAITSPLNGNNPKSGGPCPTLTNDSRYYIVGEIDDNKPF